jgi:enoyl-CoA hydratase/carnithine racemase
VGATASAGTVIAFAGNTRLISKNSRYLIHKPMVGAMGNSDDFKKVLSQLESLDAQLVNLYAERSKLSKDEILALMIKEEFISADQALEYGFVDGIIEENTTKKFTNKKTESMEKVLKALSVDSEEKAINAITDLQGIALKVSDLEVTNTILNEEGEDKDKEIEELKATIASLEEKLKEKEVTNAEEEAEEIEDAINKAVQNKKITDDTRNEWQEIGNEKGIKHLNKLLNSIPEPKEAKLSQRIVTGNPYNSKDDLTAAFKANKITAGEYQKQLKRF